MQGLDLAKAIPETAYNLKTMFLEPGLSHFSWGEAFYQVGITLGLAFLCDDFRCSHCIFFSADGSD